MLGAAGLEPVGIEIAEPGDAAARDFRDRVRVMRADPKSNDPCVDLLHGARPTARWRSRRNAVPKPRASSTACGGLPPPEESAPQDAGPRSYPPTTEFARQE